MGRAPCCDKASVKRGPWSPEEDQKLKEYIEKHGTVGNWIALPQKAGLKRCGKSCRLRWLNYLRPDIKHGEFSEEEDRLICSLYASIGSRWSIIAGQLPGRTDNDIKNYWNTKLKKKLMGLVSSSSTTSQKRAIHAPNTYPSYNNSINNNNLFTGYAPNSVQTSPKLEEPQPYFGPTQKYHFKDNNNVLSFGGGGVQASCSTSSDGSYNNNQIISHEIAADHETMVSLESNYNSGLFGETQVDYSSLEEIKQLISTSNVCGNLNSFSFDEKVMYY